MLEVRELHAWYDESHALHGVGLDVGKGEVVTLVGRNGAGKSTTLKSIVGIIRKKRGSIRLHDEPIERQPSHRIARMGVAFVPEERGIYAGLSVMENLTLPPVVGASAWPLERIFALFPRLRERARSPGTTLSGGEQQMLAIARALRTGPSLLLLDEPTEGLAPSIVKAIRDLILEIKRDGITVLLVSQNVRFAAKVSDRHYLMVNGRIVESLANAQVIDREHELLEYLGV
ncbi:MAG: ABC transporter ATP-binding protein [Candidatus Eremiobacteraeota bacterium]|nr:ABC transporter ATP-binding protein [Candidatus Eremiobacteraeota bacterium]